MKDDPKKGFYFFLTSSSSLYNQRVLLTIYYNQIIQMGKKAEIISTLTSAPVPSKPIRRKTQRAKVSFSSKTTLPSTMHNLNEPIFDEEDGVIKAPQPKKIRTRLVLPPPQPVMKQDEDDYFPDLSQSGGSDYSVEKGKAEDGPILFAQNFLQVSEIDFKIFVDSISRSKIYSAMLVDNMGRIVYSDKLGHQLFEGSLNNFQTLRVQNMLLKTLRESFLSGLKNTRTFDEATIFNWIIYSKNTKRRYSRVPFNTQNASDIFYRFLKSLTVRIRPIKMRLRDTSSIEGFWNPNIPTNELREYYLMEVRLCAKMPNLSASTLCNDPLLIKYTKVNSKKAEKWARETDLPEVQRNKKRQKRTPQLRQQPVPNDDYGCSSPSASQSMSFSESEERFPSKSASEQGLSESRGVELITGVFIEDI